MSDTKKILILAGDGIGPEVVRETERVMEQLSLNFEITHGLVGGCSYDQHGTPLTDETLADAAQADAILLGAVGGPKWQDVPYDKRPEAGLLRLRKELDLFANLRPAHIFDCLLEASSLKSNIVKGLDIIIVRELVSGVYFGTPRGIETLDNGERRGFNTQSYTSSEIRRVAEVAFELARLRRNTICSCDKSNVMESGLLWREEVTELHQKSYSDVTLSHMYADNLSMQLVRDPCQFDIILADNLFGDLLSDQAAMLTGSLGLLPSASLGATDEHGKRAALYEPVHGSAPDIAGQNIANPLATILSLAMMLEFSFDRKTEAAHLKTAVENVLKAGLRTRDLTAKDPVSTTEMGDAILEELKKTS